jgi:hypothetical protein
MKIIREFAMVLGLGTLIFIVLLGSSKGEVGWSQRLVWQFLYIVVGYTFTLYVSNTLVFKAMDRIFGKGRMTLKRLLAGFASSFVVSLFIILLLRIFEEVVMGGATFEEYLNTEKASNYYLAIALTLGVNVLVHAFYFYKRYQENRVKEQKIIAGTASAQFETLKNQIDPHFLFNSLNVLSSLIEENPDSAQKFTTSLSKVYRYVLEQKDKELVSVQEELAFAKTYMNLLKMRFENSVFYELPEEISNPEAKVVPLSLQLLLENTIKHNVVSQQRPLHIRIFEEDGYLVVQNDLQKKEVLQDRRGVGLQNIVSRYGIITARKVHVEETQQHFTVKLPILTKQLGIMETAHFDETENSYYKAQRKVEEIKGFYGNLYSFILVNIGLMILNLVTYPNYLWFLWPFFGWGIGVAIHAMSVFNLMPFLGADWEEKKIREIMERNKTNKWS